ncbi:helix-turn-helix domain-containing protein [Mesorhizobium sp. 43Arga]
MSKPVYAALPARALGDKELTAEHFRVLGAVAAHDRLGANGTGCYAGHPRLAGVAGCHLKSLSRALAALESRGYITVHKHPMNGRLRVYRVVYNELDGAYFKNVGNENATDQQPEPDPWADANAMRKAAQASKIGNSLAPNGAAIGNKDFEKILRNQ